MQAQSVKVKNELGIHARPASLIVKTAGRFKSSIQISKDGISADAKSIMNVMMLAAACESTVDITVSGDDEKDAIAAILELFANNFNE